MASREKAREAVEELARTARGSYERILDHTVTMQERSVRFAQEVVDHSIDELRAQAESNRALTEELVERAHKQRDAVQTVVEESLGAYMNLAFAPLPYFKESPTVAGEAAR